MTIRSLGEASPKVSPQATRAPSHTPAPHHAAPAHGTGERSPFQRMLEGIGKEINRGERTVRGALAAGGSELAPTDLLALQAGVYRYSEAVDLASKLVDRASSGVKTVVNGGGQ
jgi:hypothetical protein